MGGRVGDGYMVEVVGRGIEVISNVGERDFWKSTEAAMLKGGWLGESIDRGGRRGGGFLLPIWCGGCTDVVIRWAATLNTMVVLFSVQQAAVSALRDGAPNGDH